MAVHPSPKIQARINDMMAATGSTDADALIERALILLEERNRIRTLSDLTPEQRDELWQEFLFQMDSPKRTMTGP
jgi:hypothetical protein